MSYSSNTAFEHRSSKIARARRDISRHGGQLEIGPDGLLTVRRRRGKTGLPLRGLLLLVGVLVVAKALMLAHDGPAAYGERVAALAQGGAVEQAGAWILQPDPLSVYLGAQIAPLLK